MADRGGAAQRPEKKSHGLVWLLAGLVTGILAAVFLPDLAAPYLPDALSGEQNHVAGVVEAKSTEGDRVLLTIGSEAGATLVTFRDDIAEIDLLVSVGDSVLLSVDEYAPFINDAEISRVMKPRDWRAAPAGALDTAAGPDPAVRADTTAAADTAAGTDTAAVADTGDARPADTAAVTDTLETEGAEEGVPPAGAP